MTNATAPLIEPTDTPCSEDEAATRAMLRRELEVLGELAELGLRMARAIVDQATPAADGDLPFEASAQEGLALAYTRVSRAVRMAVLLQSKLIQGPKDEARKAARDEDEGPVEWRVEWVDEDDEADEPNERPESAEAERRERLERDDIYAAVMGRPTGEIIERIREDLGVAPLPLDGGEAGSGVTVQPQQGGQVTSIPSASPIKGEERAPARRLTLLRLEEPTTKIASLLVSLVRLVVALFIWTPAHPVMSGRPAPTQRVLASPQPQFLRQRPLCSVRDLGTLGSGVNRLSSIALWGGDLEQ